MDRSTPPTHLGHLGTRTLSRHGLLDERYTRRQFLTYAAVMEHQGDFFAVRDLIDTAAQEHPDWDMDEELTWGEWLAQNEKGKEAP